MKRFADRMPQGAATHVAIIRHPLHPMLVPFPIAFLVSVLASDLAYLYLNDAFWAQVSYWLLAGGTVMGLVAGLVGTVELLAVRHIRHRVSAWSHFVAAVTLLGIAAANWGLRHGEPESAVTPWGLYLSGLGVFMVGMSGWLGGALVFEHKVGVVDPEEE